MVFLDIETTTFFQDEHIKALPRDQQIAAMEFGIAVTIDKLFGTDAANATTYVVTGWTKKVSKGQNVRSTIIELSDDECDAISDSLMANGEPIKAKYEADKKLVESGTTSGK